MANVTLRQKKIANDKLSLYLDYFPPIISPKTGKETRREFLRLKIHKCPQNQLEKEHNKTTIELAEAIRAKRLVQLKNREFGFKENFEVNVNFVDYYATIVNEYINNSGKSNALNWSVSFKYFNAFIGNKISSQNLTLAIANKYRVFLLTTNRLNSKDHKLSQNTAATYYKHFIFVLKRAYKENIISVDLAKQTEYIKQEETFREYLTEDELIKLWNTDF